MKSSKDAKNHQKDKFIQAAKEHGCDESEAAFAAKVKKIAKSPKKSKN